MFLSPNLLNQLTVQDRFCFDWQVGGQWFCWEVWRCDKKNLLRISCLYSRRWENHTKIFWIWEKNSIPIFPNCNLLWLKKLRIAIIVGDVFLSRLAFNLLGRTRNKEKFPEVQTRAMWMIFKACFHVSLIKNRDRLCNFIEKVCCTRDHENLEWKIKTSYSLTKPQYVLRYVSIEPHCSY